MSTYGRKAERDKEEEQARTYILLQSQ